MFARPLQGHSTADTSRYAFLVPPADTSHAGTHRHAVCTELMVSGELVVMWICMGIEAVLAVMEHTSV